MIRRLCRAVVIGLLSIGLLPAPQTGTSEERLSSTARMWGDLIGEADALGLPTKFLKTVPPDFVRFEFDDLHSYAAEYHPGEHRMVLNRTLSFNRAGATLRPLTQLTSAEIETIYHELFHAYIDYLVTAAEGSPERPPDPVLAFAKVQQRCHYGAVLITPVMQRKGETEERFLTERESWEALNESWAVFVGWVVWSELELTGGAGRTIRKSGKSQNEWVSRLMSADRDGIFRGYYEPEDSGERTVARKRYLAPASRLSEPEAAILMKNVMEFPPSLIARVREALSGAGQGVERHDQC
ncbi:MAG TPA: hypothetical protein VLA67_12955 [Nitrospiraceae bacterium]|nr:hypothetical protein [Nitrospiraceae bacterium]